MGSNQIDRTRPPSPGMLTHCRRELLEAALGGLMPMDHALERLIDHVERTA